MHDGIQRATGPRCESQLQAELLLEDLGAFRLDVGAAAPFGSDGALMLY
jgi:hypothetical protein